MLTGTSKYTQEQLSAAFTLVQNKKHWKNPISASIDPKDADITEAAIIHFTGSVPTFTPTKGGKLRVRAAGYYLTIGS